ncbi:hypothetical protein [Streptomyces sp. NPDC005828]|uniref:hypothetical protein n=1 Tax=Streptomyces sp. NPDC005828 TaxID=3157071 RepID=UPI0033FD5472
MVVSATAAVRPVSNAARTGSTAAWRADQWGLVPYSIGELQTEEASDASWRDLADITNLQLRQHIATALRDADSGAAMTGQLTLAEPWPLVSE